MFEIIDDEILFDRHAVATLRPEVWSTLRDQVEDALSTWEPGMVSEEAYQKDVKRLENECEEQVKELQERIEDLETENERLAQVLVDIDEAGSGAIIAGLLARLVEAQKPVNETLAPRAPAAKRRKR